jgi:transposase
MAQSLAAHYGMLLGLDSSWEVADVNLELEAKRVTIRLGFVGRRVTCPGCGESCSKADHAPERTWRHLDTMQFETILVARVPRADCKACGVKTGEVPWAGKSSPFTWMFEAFALSILEASRCVEAARQVLRLSWDATHRIMKRGVERGLLDRDLGKVKKIGIDEKSFMRGQSYVTCLADLEQVRVIDVVEGRKQEDAQRLLDALPESLRGEIQAVAMDMWPAFINAVGEKLPEAEVVFDRFHVSKHMGEAVDAVRRSEHKQLAKTGDTRLVGTRYDWLRAESSISSGKREEFDALKQSELKTARAWAIKELLKAFWECPSEGFAETHFDRWYNWAIRSRLGPVKKVARMLKKHLDGLLAYFRHWITNAATEGLNSKIQQIKAAARGFRNFEHYRIRILFFCGRLVMRPKPAH